MRVLVRKYETYSKVETYETWVDVPDDVAEEYRNDDSIDLLESLQGELEDAGWDFLGDDENLRDVEYELETVKDDSLDEEEGQD